MERSLFTRFFEVSVRGGQIHNAMSITKQYRMHPEICWFPNKYFYDGRLTSKVASDSSHFGLMPYNVFKLDCRQSNTDSINYHNIYEAEFIINLLKVMIRHANPKTYSYGIITPYSSQRGQIEKLIG